MPTKFELERDAQRLTRHQRVAEQIKETDKGMSRETSRTLLLYIGDIVPDPDQPRRFYDEDTAALQELATSIRAVGVLSPIQVQPDSDIPDKYKIIVGERRWRACQIAGVNRIEAVVREGWDPFQIRAAQYEENEKRQDVSDIARARSLTAMRQSETGRKRGWEEIADRVGLQRNHAMRLVGLLQLPEGAVSLIDRRLLPGTHGAELVRLLKRVPDADIVALAESCAAPVPGGKARCPVKELARTVTDRLQAIHEQQTSVTEEQQDGIPSGGDANTDFSNGLRKATGAPETLSHKNSGSVNTEDSNQGDNNPTVTIRGNGQNAERENNMNGQGTENEFTFPRVFVQELVHAWKSNLLTVVERRLIRDAWQTYPLLEEDPQSEIKADLESNADEGTDGQAVTRKNWPENKERIMISHSGNP